MSDYPHLNAAAASVVQRTQEERLVWMAEQRWIGYPTAKEGLAKLARLMRTPKKHRMPNLLIVGHTNNGKTSIVERFVEDYPRLEQRKDDGYVDVPIMNIQAPPTPDENSFYCQILDQLFAVYRDSEKIATKRSKVVSLLLRANTKLLIIDEIHNILAGHLEKQRQFLNVIRYLGNELRIPIVALGTKDALRAVHADPQLSNRFEPFALPRWKPDKNFQQLLASFESILPLKRASKIYQPQIQSKLCSLCEGLIGELSELLNRLAEEAIDNGTEQITYEQIVNFNWRIPSQRKKETEKML